MGVWTVLGVLLDAAIANGGGVVADEGVGGRDHDF